MKASETTLQSVIENQRQYIVPLYQRAYRWEKKHWQVLWDDLVDVCDIEGVRSHFLGSLVTMPTSSVPEGVPKFFLIDGQQRLTTIFILLTLLRDRARTGTEPLLGEEIQNTLLVNAYKKGDDYFRLLPTQDDRPTFQALIRGETANPASRITHAYQFFDLKLRGKGPDVAALKRAITERLSVVSITLDRDDNPYLVFESLNAKGEPLTQADLIRNFFLLKIHSDRQREVYDRYWRPMEAALGDDLTEFIRHFLMRRGSFLREDSVYFTLKDALGPGDALEFLAKLSASAMLYARLLDPTKEARSVLSSALSRLGRLQLRSVFPFLLTAYEELEAGRISLEEMTDIVLCFENFLVRRLVCNIPTNQLNKLIPPLYNQILSGGFSDLADGVRRLLPTKGYPGDIEFRKDLIGGKVYGQGDRRGRTKFLLESIEASFKHKEVVSTEKLEVEHIMPQTLTDRWREALGEEWEATHQLALDTLGNLTLTGYNPELSNMPFEDKKKEYERSHLELNRYFADVLKWDGEAIDARGAALADRALIIWPHLAGEAIEPAPGLDPSKKPLFVRFLDRTRPVSTWKSVLEATVLELIEAEPELLGPLTSEFPALISDQPNRFRSTFSLPGGLYLNTHHSSKAVVRWCERLLEFAEVSPEDWKVETAA